MVEDIVKAWRDPYFRDVEARADAVKPHPAGEINQVDLESVVGGSEEETFLSLSCWITCPDPATNIEPTCPTLNSWNSNCCCGYDTTDPFYCI
jgi:mersacidin/lichenicidin family type 2 lantibiotic